MRLLLLATVVVAAMSFEVRPAPAYEQVFPWCAVVSLGTGSAYWDCRYSSIEACRPNVIAGNRGFCNPNPAWKGPAEPIGRHARRRYGPY